MLLSESVTSERRFMQSSGVREEPAALLICPRRHSNRAWSDTSINSPSSTKFTLVFTTLPRFISSCRISQSYSQSRSCRRVAAGSRNDNLFFWKSCLSPSFSQPVEKQRCCSLTPSPHTVFFVQLPSQIPTVGIFSSPLLHELGCLLYKNLQCSRISSFFSEDGSSCTSPPPLPGSDFFLGNTLLEVGVLLKRLMWTSGN